MRLVHVITSLDTGGAERMLVKLLSGLDRGRFDPVVVSLMGEGSQGAQIRALGVPVYTLNMRSSRGSLPALLRLRRLFQVLQPDVVHGWMYHGALAALLCQGGACGVAGIRQSLDDIRREKPGTRWVIRTLGRFAAKRAGFVVYNAAVSARQHEALGYPAEKSVVIPNGFDCERFRPDADAGRAVRTQLGIDADAPVIGHVARFHPMKDHACFLRAAAMAAQADPRVCFLMAGAGVVAGNPSFGSVLDEPGLEGRVHLLGERSDAPALYNAMDVFCLSSWSEGFPNVLGEAMACGVPCVSTDVGDSAHLLGDCGRVVPPHDPEALADAWRSMLALDRKDRMALGERGRQRVIEHFSLEAVVRQYESLYQRLVDRDRK